MYAKLVFFLVIAKFFYINKSNCVKNCNFCGNFNFNLMFCRTWSDKNARILYIDAILF